MLSDGEKGVIIQRDKVTYAVAPHLVCGLADPQTLRKIADIAERHRLTIKITSEQRIALIGIRPEQVDAVWADLGMKPGHVVGNTVRGVKACPGTDFCKRGQQDSLAMGRLLDQRYHGIPLPGKMKLGVSGCLYQCAETNFKDIGLVGKPKGWTLVVGGCGGGKATIGTTIASDLSSEAALAAVDKLVEFFKLNARPHERMARLINRVGVDTIRSAAGLMPAIPASLEEASAASTVKPTRSKDPPAR